MPISLERIDHIVITVNDIEKSIRFYCDVLGMQETNFGDNRKAVAFGNQKINLHPIANNISLTATSPSPGSVDICLVCSTPAEELVNELKRHGIAIEAGPVERQGAMGPMTSVYIRDPDGNLIELSNYDNQLSYIYDYV